MKINLLAMSFAVIFCSTVLASVVPLPSKSPLLLGEKEQQIVNDLNEQEETVVLNNEAVKVLNLNWFDSMDAIFTKYQKVRVIDIKSKTEYYVKRMGGYNHADVQTVDAKNTAIFKKIYGGTWSWTRRPVWVEINGQFYAGSTNGMPHGFDILQTGEGGHTCIHFLNSKTHGTKRVDEQHQACVEYASKNQNLLNEYLKNKLK